MVPLKTDFGWDQQPSILSEATALQNRQPLTVPPPLPVILGSTTSTTDAVSVRRLGLVTRVGEASQRNSRPPMVGLPLARHHGFEPEMQVHESPRATLK